MNNLIKSKSTEYTISNQYIKSKQCVLCGLKYCVWLKAKGWLNKGKTFFLPEFHLDAFRKNCEKRLLASSRPSLHLSAWNRSAPNSRISINFDICFSKKKIVWKIQNSLISDKNDGTLHLDRYSAWNSSAPTGRYFHEIWYFKDFSKICPENWGFI